MRLLVFALFALTASVCVHAAESPTAYPLWNGVEPTADYAKRVNLPPTQTLDIGNGVKLELVLIPAGEFTMGTPKPVPVDEKAFNQKVIVGQLLMAMSAGAVLVMLAFVTVQAIRYRRRPQLSLRLLMLVTVATGGGVLSGVHWQQSLMRWRQRRANMPLHCRDSKRRA